jgi:serine/threonine protein kinase
VIINHDGYVKLADFGLAKEGVNDENKAMSFCGTPEYLAPEILEGIPYSKAVDWWNLGVILFEMLTGTPPFYNSDRDRLFRQIKRVDVKYPIYLSRKAVNFMKKIFVKEGRLGSKGVEEIKEDPFFEGINWNDILNKKLKPPFIPNLKSPSDTKYIDDEFLLQESRDSFRQGESVESKEDLFSGFSYNNCLSENLSQEV